MSMWDIRKFDQSICKAGQFQIAWFFEFNLTHFGINTETQINQSNQTQKSDSLISETQSIEQSIEWPLFRSPTISTTIHSPVSLI